jgi:hypothetical protein
MRRSVQSMTPLLWVIAIALLAVRMTEVHWHLCFDGQEPRSSLHVGDRAAHHEPPEEAATHVDTNVSLTVEMLSKAAKLDSDLPLVILGALLLWALFDPRVRIFPAFRRPVPATAAPAFLRPPLRGPPR